VIIGASISGLLAARVLSRHFEHVTLVDRDALPDDGEPRKGAPQGAHGHGLLANGYRIIDAYFPGLFDELEAAGAPRGDIGGDFLWFQYGRWKLRYPSGLRGIVVSRPYLEGAIRRRIRAIPNVTLVRAEAAHPNFNRTAGRVTGLLLERRGGRRGGDVIEADLVVDASGRGSQAPRWLEHWGFEPPREVAVEVNVGYATRTFERRPGDFFNSLGAIIAGTPPAGTRMGGALAVEGNRWIVTLSGTLGDHPPLDETGWTQFAASLPVPAIHDLVTANRPLTNIAIYRFPANRRRYYERMRRFPKGFLTIGDAVCSFNPIYGQGMTVAASEARALDEALGAGRERLAERYHARARKLVDIAWDIATGEDLRFPQVKGRRPSGSWAVNRYLDRVHAAASEDPVVCRRFFDVLNLLAPPTALMAPQIAWRVLRRRVPAGMGSPMAMSAT
jgi:2-polyprenyl-6-methoxyphenol hydroxylase-like FAD-dependent oxidoreductase